MSDMKTPLGDAPDRQQVLFGQAAFLMAKGAGFGAALFFGIIIMVLLFKLVGTWLPDESREMPDPNILQRGSIELLAPKTTA